MIIYNDCGSCNNQSCCIIQNGFMKYVKDMTKEPPSAIFRTTIECGYYERKGDFNNEE